MRKLNKNQIEFIADSFFKNEIYAGWKNIAGKLLTSGRCIVAGDDCIWKGGIGNFIKINNQTEFVDCVEYVFDLEIFLTSAWFKEIITEHIMDIGYEIKELEHKHNDLKNLM